MERLAYKYRIKDKRTRRALAAHAYAANQVWNWCVAQHKDAAERFRSGARRRPWPTGFDLGKQCASVGAMLGTHQHVVGAVCIQFARSRDQHKRCPAFRSSFGLRRKLGWVPIHPAAWRIEGNVITFMRQRYRLFGTKRRPVPADAKGGAFVEDACGHWFAVIYVGAQIRPQPNDGAIGVDLGLKALATTSDGEVIENPCHLRAYAERLAVAQRAGNKRRAKAIHMKIANTRRDFHHKLSRRLASEYAFIAVGNVNAKRLAKTKMAKSVLDAGWSSFRDMLRYKAATFVEVDERFTTQTCSSCGALPPERPKGIAGLGIRAWDCSACGASHDRDVNAARNILKLARSVPRPGEESRRIAA